MKKLLGACALALGLATASAARADDSRVKIRPRLGAETILYHVNIPDSWETIPTHPSDKAIFGGETTANLSWPWVIEPRGGLELAVGSEKLRFTAGDYMRFNLFSFQEGQHGGWSKSVQHNEDKRPANQGAYVFSAINPKFISHNPYFGLLYQVHDEMQVGVEAGVIFQDLKWTAGHDRWGAFSPIRGASWKGNGLQVRLVVNTLKDLKKRSSSVGFYVQYEQYTPRFSVEQEPSEPENLTYTPAIPDPKPSPLPFTEADCPIQAFSFGIVYNGGF